ncbi:hypothetical protein ACFX13_042372 [Malus domestica]
MENEMKQHKLNTIWGKFGENYPTWSSESPRGPDPSNLQIGLLKMVIKEGFWSNQTRDNTNSKVRKKDGNLEDLGEAFLLSDVVNDVLKLGDSDFVAIVDPVVELWNHIQARVFERADFVVEGRLLGPARVGPAIILGTIIIAHTK